MKEYIMKEYMIYSSMIGRLLLVLGGLNYLFITLFGGYNQYVTQLTTTSPYLTNAIAIGIGLAALMFLFDRNYYLSFLGPCVFPIAGQNEDQSSNQISLKLTGLPSNVNVVYWGAKESKNAVSGYKEAYGNYTNSGVVTTNNRGEALIKVSCPGQYSIKKFGMLEKQLPKHIHYRYEFPDSRGMFSEVYTQNIDC
jgi:uncharacterized membrane protein YuzA (DUF378 family)